MDLYLADRTYDYVLSVYFKKYHSNSTIGEPFIEIPISITTFNTTTCVNVGWLESAVLVESISESVIEKSSIAFSYLIEIDTIG